MHLTAPYWSVIAVIRACHAHLASAELWGFIEEAGVARFSTQRVEDRYELFFKGPTSLDAQRNGLHKRNDKAAVEGTALYRRVADHPNARKFAALIERNARAQALDPALIKAVIAVESGFEPDAVSAKGARGLMQVIPATAMRYGLIERRDRTISQQLLDPSINVRISVRYLRDLLDLFSDDLSLALAAYNAGEQSVRDSGNRIPPYKETREYVDLVRQFQAMYAPPEPPIAAPARPRIDVRAVHDTRLSSMQAP